MTAGGVSFEGGGRVDFALFTVAALTNQLIHEVPAIVGCKTGQPSPTPGFTRPTPDARVHARTAQQA